MGHSGDSERSRTWWRSAPATGRAPASPRGPPAAPGGPQRRRRRRLTIAHRLVVDRAFAAAGLERFVVIEVTDITMTADYVRQGLGVAIMPSFAVAADDPGVCVRPVAGGPLEWSLGVAYSSVRRPGAALTALLALIGRFVRVPPGAP